MCVCLLSFSGRAACCCCRRHCRRFCWPSRTTCFCCLFPMVGLPFCWLLLSTCCGGLFVYLFLVSLVCDVFRLFFSGSDDRRACKVFRRTSLSLEGCGSTVLFLMNLWVSVQDSLLLFGLRLTSSSYTNESERMLFQSDRKVILETSHTSF